MQAPRECRRLSRLKISLDRCFVSGVHVLVCRQVFFARNLSGDNDENETEANECETQHAVISSRSNITVRCNEKRKKTSIDLRFLPVSQFN